MEFYLVHNQKENWKKYFSVMIRIENQKEKQFTFWLWTKWNSVLAQDQKVNCHHGHYDHIHSICEETKIHFCGWRQPRMFIHEMGGNFYAKLRYEFMLIWIYAKWGYELLIWIVCALFRVCCFQNTDMQTPSPLRSGLLDIKDAQCEKKKIWA